MSTDAVVAALEDLAAALEATDLDPTALDAAEGALDRLDAAYDAVEAAEAVRQRRVLAARAAVSEQGGDVSALVDYATAQTAAEAGRVGALAGTAAFLDRPTGTDPSALADSLSDLADRERALGDLAGPAEDAAAGVDLPPLLAVTGVTAPEGPVVLGGTFEVGATVRSAGDATATGVAVSAGGDLPTDPGTASVGDLPPGESATVAFAVEASEAGTATVDLSATADDADGVDRSATVEVLDKAGAAGLAGGTLSDLEATIEAAFDGGRERSLLAPLEAAGDSVERAVEFAAEDRGKQADNQLNTASRQVGAFLNQFETLDSGRPRDGPSDLVVRTVRGLAESVADQIALARRAPV